MTTTTTEDLAMLDEFIAFVGSKPRDEHYDAYSQNCAIGQFVQHKYPGIGNDYYAGFTFFTLPERQYVEFIPLRLLAHRNDMQFAVADSETFGDLHDKLVLLRGVLR